MGLGWLGVDVAVGAGAPEGTEGTEGVALGTVGGGDVTSGGTTGSGLGDGEGTSGSGMSCAWARVKMRANARSSTSVNLRVMMKCMVVNGVVIFVGEC